MEENRLAKAQAAQTQLKLHYTNLSIGNRDARQIVAGYYDSASKLVDFHDIIKYCRWFYTYDPIAGTVIERMADMAITQLRNRRKSKTNIDIVDDTTMAFYDTLTKKIRPFLKHVALEYLINGLVIPDYTINKIRGNLLAEKLGRKRYFFPENIWARNVEFIELRRRPVGMSRMVYARIPPEDIQFIQSKGLRPDGTKDTEGYKYIVEHFPEYVSAIRRGETKFLLPDVRPILRKTNSYSDYPTPFLTKAIKALQHKEYLKTMDRSIASRAIEAIRHIKVGNDTFPADDDDITDVRNLIEENSSSGERVFNLVTNHTVDIGWSFPELEALLNEQKYVEPNADIFLGLGFPRVLTVGETQRSNSSDSKIAALGPKSTLDDLRDAIIVWLEELYQELAEKNNFTRYPEPYFSPIATSDYTALVQFSIEALKAGAISKNTVSQLYGSDYETEAAQIESEQQLGILSPQELEKEKERQFTLELTNQQQDQDDDEETGNDNE